MRRKFLWLAMVWCVSSVAAAAEDHPTYESLWNQAINAPNHSVKEDDTAIMVRVPGEKQEVFYFFTKPGNPAHPGVVARDIYEENGKVMVRLHGWSFGPDSAQPAFKAWLDAFVEQNKRIRERAQHLNDPQ